MRFLFKLKITLKFFKKKKKLWFPFYVFKLKTNYEIYRRLNKKICEVYLNTKTYQEKGARNFESIDIKDSDTKLGKYVLLIIY